MVTRVEREPCACENDTHNNHREEPKAEMGHGEGKMDLNGREEAIHLPWASCGSWLINWCCRLLNLILPVVVQRCSTFSCH